MKRSPLLFVLVAAIAASAALTLAAPPAAAVKIAPMPTKDLVQKSKVILIGKVDTVKDNTRAGGAAAPGWQYLSVTVGTVVKGKTTAKVFTIALHYAGGKKAFDPKLAAGNVAVFFLRSLEEGEGKLTHWGSVAPFKGGDYLYKP